MKTATITAADMAAPETGAATPATPKPAAPASREGVELKHRRDWSRTTVTIVQAAVLVAIIAGWEVGARLGVVNTFFWSYPSDIGRVALIFVREGTALQDTWFTFRATVIGFVAGSTLGALIGLSLWWSTNAARVVEPFIVVFNAIPKMALGPLIILIFGIGIVSKIALAIALTFVITALAAYSGVKAVDEDLVKLTYSLGGRRRDVFMKIVLPSSMPWIVSSLRINIGLALAGVLVGEFISSKYGLGKTIMYAGSTYDMALIWVGIIILSMLSMALYGVVVWMEQRLLKGFHASERSNAGGG